MHLSQQVTQALAHTFFLECNLHLSAHSGMQSANNIIKHNVAQIWIKQGGKKKSITCKGRWILPAFVLTGGIGVPVGGFTGGTGVGGLTTGG